MVMAAIVTETGPQVKLTEIGEIPSDWNLFRLCGISLVTSGKRLPKGETLVESPTPYPYIRVTDMRMGTVDTSDVRYVPEQLAPTISRYRIFHDDIFVSVAGTLGIVGRIPVELDGANLTENADRITNIKCSREYLMHVLQSDIIQTQIEEIRTVGAQPKLALTRLRLFPIPLPPTRKEQDTIAEALSDADSLIDSLEALIAKKRAIKQGAMQGLLSGRKRLPGFAGEWSARKLGELGPWVGGGTPSMTRSDFWANGTVPWASSADVRLGSVSADLRRISEKAVAGSATRLVPAGSVILVTRSGILRRFLPVCCLSAPIAINQDLKALIPRTKAVGRFVGQCLLHHNASILASCMKTGTTVESIEMSWLKKFEIMMPPDDVEMDAVSTLLAEFDDEIVSLESKLAKARQIKQGMMQELLTGKVRLV